jgi:hypothetical protein
MAPTVLLLLALAVGPAASASPSERPVVSVRVALANDPVSMRCDPDDLVATLRRRIERSHRLRWSGDDTPAQVTLRVLECAVVRDSKVVFDEAHQPIKLPLGGEKGAFGGEYAYGVRSESRTLVVLRVSASREDGVEEVADSEKGRRLDQVVGYVVKDLEDRVDRWGLAGRPR